MIGESLFLSEEGHLKNLRSKVNITIAGLVWFCAAPIVLYLAPAAENARAQEYSTVVNSNPQGVFISLDGEHRLSAVTPCRLPSTLSGSYRLKATLPGYESWSGEIIILPGQDNTITFTLSPKTRIKAALRSLLVPGWGQYYSGQKGRSLIFAAAAVGLGIGTASAHDDYRRKRDNYRRTLLELSNATTAEEAIRLRMLAYDHNKQAYDAETKRNSLFAVLIGVWAYNILDNLFFFPERNFSALPFIQAEFNGDEARVALSLAF